MSPLFANDSLKNDLLKGILKVQNNFNNKNGLGTTDIFNGVSWGKMSQEQVDLVKAKLRELGEQG